jgi:hypothetical protein
MSSHTSSPRIGRGHDLPSKSKTLVVHFAAENRLKPTGVDIYAGTAALVEFGAARARRLITLAHEVRK